MKYTVPDYYKDFKCIASQCPDTCCAGWQIMIDEKALKRYGEIDTAFGNRLRNSIDWENGCFEQYEERCAFLNEENLCDIYTEAGETYLCRTCRLYPRHIEEFENERELSLSVSCPVVAELLLKKKEKAAFIEKSDDKTEEEYEDFDFFLYSALQDSRAVMLEILQDRTKTIEFRMAKLLSLAHDIQNRINAEKIFDIQNVLERYTRQNADEVLEIKFHRIYSETAYKEFSEELFSLMDQLEVLNKSWPSFVNKCKDAWRKGEYKSRIMNQQGLTSIQKEQLMVYFIYTYYCGAVYDGDALAKVKMAISFVLLCECMIKAEAVCTEDHDLQFIIEEIVRKFSRELEHSDQNLNKMEELMKTEKNFKFKNVLRMIWM